MAWSRANQPRAIDYDHASRDAPSDMAINPIVVGKRIQRWFTHANDAATVSGTAR